MKKSTRSFFFPDINVWVAMSYERHAHHSLAKKWFEGLAPTARLFFCRLTQLGLLRLLSSSTVMGPDGALSQPAAWAVYDEWLNDERVEFLEEPAAIENEFRGMTRLPRAASKDWADSYLAAFAQASRLTLVTLDRDFQSKTKDLVLLE
jgi:uncharacterized protein